MFSVQLFQNALMNFILFFLFDLYLVSDKKVKFTKVNHNYDI